MGWFSDALFGKRKQLDTNRLNQYMQPTQDLVTRGVGQAQEMSQLGRDFMDPLSQQNQQYRGMITQNALEMGAQGGRQAASFGAQQGVPQGIAQMQSQVAAQKPLQGLNDQFQSFMMGNRQQGMNALGQGAGLLGQSAEMQQGLNENQANAYMAQINAHNQRRQQNMAMTTQVVGAAIGAASDFALKEGIELVGKSPKGVNIYEFGYKDKSYGRGRYKGVIAQEVPNASFKHQDGYLWVDYSKLDVNFKRID
jgi:hypothetical protein